MSAHPVLFAVVGLSSEEEASDDEGDASREDDKGAAARPKFDEDEWESSSDEKRVILTASEKLVRQLQDVLSLAAAAMDSSVDLKAPPADADISQWPTVPQMADARDQLVAGMHLLKKYQKAVEQDGIPGFFVRECAKFADQIMRISDFAKADKAFNSVIPKDIKKILENVVRWIDRTLKVSDVGKLIVQYRADPTNSRWLDPAAREAQEEISEEDEKDRHKGPKRGTREFWVKQPGEDSSSDDSDQNDDWLNDSVESGEEREERKPQKAKPGAKTKKHKEKTLKEESEDDSEENLEQPLTRSRAEPLEEERELKAEDVDRLTEEMAQLRGRKGTDYARLLQRLELIFPKAKNDVQRIRLLVLWVNTRFDSVRSAKARLSAKDWRLSVENIRQVLSLLRSNPTFRLLELDSYFDAELEGEDDEVMQLGEEMNAAKKRELVEKNKGEAASAAASGMVVISGSLFALLERLDSAFMRTLLQIDPHTQEYVTRLSDDPEFVAVAKEMLDYQLGINDGENAARTAHYIISHLYYKSHTPGAEGEPPKLQDRSAELHKYSKYVYAHGTPRQKAQVMLMGIYHLSLMDNFSEARDRMLMSHLQDKAPMMDVETQILFNRTNVQIGLCAFRAGLIREAHSALSEIYAGGRVKELLAQGTSSQRYQDRDKELEKVEKSRLLPYHLHINLELLETCHLIAAMLLEVPAMASERYSKGGIQDSKLVMSKYLRKLVDYHERQVFAGPPETTRDFVVAAARALSRGNWKKTQTLLLSRPVWDLLHKPEDVKRMLAVQVQEVGLTTYLFTYCNCFETLSISMLANLFELSEARVHAIVSGMILSEELKASWSQPTKTLVLHHVEPSSLQNAAMKFTTKIAAFLESNEALLESRFGNFSSSYQKYDKEKEEFSGRSSERPDRRRGGGGGGGGGSQKQKDDRYFEVEESERRYRPNRR